MEREGLFLWLGNAFGLDPIWRTGGSIYGKAILSVFALTFMISWLLLFHSATLWGLFKKADVKKQVQAGK